MYVQHTGKNLYCLQGVVTLFCMDMYYVTDQSMKKTTSFFNSNSTP